MAPTLSSDCYNGLPTTPMATAGTCSNNSFLMFLTVIQTFLSNDCKINDPYGRVIPKTVPDEEYDFIVIGGGSSGSVVAGRLAEANQWKILLIEAGYDEPAWSQIPAFQPYGEGAEIDWKFKTEPETNACFAAQDRRCRLTRGKVLGGSGTLNAMVYARATRGDAERWVKAGNNNYTYEELLRLYKKSENNRNFGQPGIDANYHSTGGPWTIQHNNYPLQNYSLNILRAATEAGFSVQNDLNGELSQGFGRVQFNMRNGMRHSPSKAYLRPHRNNQYLHVMINSTATKILVTENKGKKIAQGVELVYNRKTYKVNAKKEVILAAGALQTPQILLLSGIGPQDELKKFNITQVHNLPGVGKGLQDHPFISISYETNRNDTTLTWDDVNTYLITEGGAMSAIKAEDVFARISSSYTPDNDPDGQFHFEPRTWCDPPGTRLFNIIAILNLPRSKGYIGLKSNNISDPPKIVQNYYTEPIDLKIMVEIVREALKLVSQPSLQQELGLVLKEQSYYATCSEQFKYNSDDFWECVIKYGTGTTGHPSSSCRMGPSTNSEVCVDQKFKIYGLENVRIVDASVFPSTIAANLQATVIALAERAAEVIKEKFL